MDLLIYFLKNIYPFIILLNFILILYLGIKNRSYFSNLLKKIGYDTYLFLAIILLLTLVLTISFSPMLDPNHSNGWEYKLSGKKLLLEGQYGSCHPECLTKEVPEHPAGYPVIIAVLFFLFGINSQLIIYLNITLALLTVALVFILSYYMFKNRIIALLSTLTIACYYNFIVYSGTGEIETISLFFTTLSVLLFFALLDNQRLNSFFVLTLLFSINVRIENVLLIPLIFLYILINKKVKSIVPNAKLYLISFLIIISTLLIFVHVLKHQQRLLNLISSPTLNSLDTLNLNLKILFGQIIEFRMFYILFSLFSLNYIRRFFKRLTFLTLWALILLVFYSSLNYSIASPEMIRRYSVSIISPLSIIIGLGLFYLYSIFKNHKIYFLLLLIVIFFPSIISLNQQYFQEDMDYRPLLEVTGKISQDADIVVPSTDEVRIIDFETGRKAYQLNVFTKNKGRKTYFIWTSRCDRAFYQSCQSFYKRFELRKAFTINGIAVYELN